MSKAYLKFKRLPTSEDFKNFKWYIVFVGQLKNVDTLEYICKERNIHAIIWSPVFQEYHRTSSGLVLVDKLLYPGYVFVGLADPQKFELLSYELSEERKGFLLGNFTNYLTREELEMIVQEAIKHSEAPSLETFHVQKGDIVIINSGPFTGMQGKVLDVDQKGRVKLKIFFMNTEVDAIVPGADVYSFGPSFYDYFD